MDERHTGSIPRRDDARRGLPDSELAIDRRLRVLLGRLPAHGIPGALTELLAFGLKQFWACLFGAALLVVLAAARLWYPDNAIIARNDALTVAAVVIQVAMVATRLETLRELRVIVAFHLVGTAMELFKTGVGSWSYDAGGIFHVGAVPLYSGFMYAAVGSYMVRVYRLFDLRFTRWPPVALTAVAAGAAYANFFTHHWLWDLRWPIVGLVILLWCRSTMHVRVFRRGIRMPVLVAFALVATFIWLAENIATWARAWTYPSQVDGWEPVGISKLVAWFLLMIVSVVLVTWVYPPRRPDPVIARATVTG